MLATFLQMEFTPEELQRIQTIKREIELLSSLHANEAGGEAIVNPNFDNIVRARTDRLRELRTLLQAAFLPLNRFPLEIIQHIFELADYDDDYRRRTRTSITQVCRLWRQAALDAPALWSTVMPLGSHNTLMMFRLHLERAKQSKLHVMLQWQGGRFSENEQCKIVDEALARQEQWKSLFLTYNAWAPSAWSRLMDGLESASLPRLRQFHIENGHDGVVTTTKWLSEALTAIFPSAAPPSFSLQLYGTHLSSSLPFPSQLKSLKLIPISTTRLNALFDLLHSCDDLETLMISSCHVPAGTHSSRVFLPRLKTLSFIINGEETGCHFIRMVHCPDLQHFQILQLSWDSTYDELSLVMIEQAWQLQTLDIERLRLTFNALARLLHAFPHVERLRTGVPEDDEWAFVKMFTERIGPTFRTCPSLRDLFLDGFSSTSAHRIAQIVEARFQSVTSRLEWLGGTLRKGSSFLDVPTSLRRVPALRKRLRGLVTLYDDEESPMSYQESAVGRDVPRWRWLTEGIHEALP